MHLTTVGLVLFALLVANCPADARRKGEENWKQRYKNWKLSEEQARESSVLVGNEAVAANLEKENFLDGSLPAKDQAPGSDALVGTDEAAAVKKEREDQWRKKIEEKKRRQEMKKEGKYDVIPSSDAQPVSEITSWIETKMKKQQYHRQAAPYELQRQRRNIPHFLQEHKRTVSNPPPHTKVAEMARYIVHHSDWAAVAYTSRQPGTYGLPMADIFSISDGMPDNSTGIPYMYVSPLDTGVQDLAKDSRCSLAMSLAQGDYCKKESLDPEDPRCAHVFLTGKMKTVKSGSDEWARAEKVFFDRHPHLRNMPKDHKFRFMKLKISHILVQDYFGGPAQPTLAEYFAAKPEDFNPVKRQPTPEAEAEAELLPGASASVKWVQPVE